MVVKNEKVDELNKKVEELNKKIEFVGKIEILEASKILSKKAWIFWFLYTLIRFFYITCYYYMIPFVGIFLSMF